MKKSEIINDISEATSVARADVEKVLDDFAGLVIDRASSGEDTSWPALGKFSGKQQAERTGISPATGAPYTSPARTVLKFAPGSKVKRQVNGEE